MWIAKFKFWHENSISIEYTKKHFLTQFIYPLNIYVKGNFRIFTSAHVLLGEEDNKMKWAKDIQKDKRVIRFEQEGDLAIYAFNAPLQESHLQMYFTPEVFLSKPITVRSDGWQYIELASWDKQKLADLLKRIVKFGKMTNQSIKRETLTDVYFPHLLPKITKKQKQAILLAYRNGYYEFPKKITIDRLADLAKVSPSTFQEHLRRAEENLLPFLLENISEK